MKITYSMGSTFLPTLTPHRHPMYHCYEPILQGKADNWPFLPGNGTLKVCQIDQNNTVSFPLNLHRVHFSAWSPHIHQKRRKGIKINGGGLLLSYPLFQRPRGKQGLTQERLRIPQGVPVFDLQRWCCLPSILLLARGGSSSMCFSNIHYKTYKNMTLVCCLCFK